MTQPLAFIPLVVPAAFALTARVAAGQSGPHPTRVVAAARAASILGLVVAAVTGLVTAVRGPMVSPLLGVVDIGPDGVGLSVRLDALSTVMFGLVAFLGAVVLHYSRTYLDGDRRHGAFLGALALTVGAVMLLVLSGNLWQLVATWISTSLALHTLLVFYRERPGAVLAARKKFLVARLGDVCLVGAAVLLARAFHTTDIGTLLERARAVAGPQASPPGVTAAGLLLAATAALKAAQFPTHGWLIEVMETPTPVSALLHAGILNGGTFLIARLAQVVLLVPSAQQGLIVVGGLTALFASLVMITQTSVKVSLAYSSAAHMGFMLLLCGIGAYPVAILHLVAHSCYKAHAFLSSGSVVDAARASWVPGVKAAPNALRALASLGVAVATVVAVSALFGVSLTARPVTLALAAILVFGLTHLVAQAMHVRPVGDGIGRTALAAAGTVLAFFALELGASRVLADVLPVSASLAPLTMVLMLVVVAAFGLVSLFQLFLPAHASAGPWAALYVHVRHGLYANALFDRLVGLPRAAARRPFATEVQG